MEKILKPKSLLLQTFFLYCFLSCVSVSVSRGENPYWMSSPTEYPHEISTETLSAFPSEFEGVYARIDFYKANKSRLMDLIFNILDTTDIRHIFKQPNYKEGNLYMYISDEPLHEGVYMFSPHLIDTKQLDVKDFVNGQKIIYIESESFIYPDSRYCFAYDNRIVFTCQYIDNLYAEKVNIYRMITDYVMMGDKTCIWTFTINDGLLTDCTVTLDGYYNHHTPVYHIMTGEMEIIKRPSE